MSIGKERKPRRTEARRRRSTSKSTSPFPPHSSNAPARGDPVLDAASALRSSTYEPSRNAPLRSTRPLPPCTPPPRVPRPQRQSWADKRSERSTERLCRKRRRGPRGDACVRLKCRRERGRGRVGKGKGGATGEATRTPGARWVYGGTLLVLARVRWRFVLCARRGTRSCGREAMSGRSGRGEQRTSVPRCHELEERSLDSDRGCRTARARKQRQDERRKGNDRVSRNRTFAAVRPAARTYEAVESSVSVQSNRPSFPQSSFSSFFLLQRRFPGRTTARERQKSVHRRGKGKDRYNKSTASLLH